MSKNIILRSVDALRQAYGLPIERIAFLTTGWVSYCYIAETVAGERYLLKLYHEAAPTPLVAGSRDFYLPLTHQLCSRQLLPQIACPVRTSDGRFSISAGPYLLILFHFIDGEPVGFGKMPDGVLMQLAGLVGRLHRSTRDLDLPNPLVEHFEIAFEELLPRWLEALASPAPADRAGWRGFQELLLPRRRELLGHLDRLKELQSVVRSRSPEMVVCHTDLHGGNLLLDGEGKLHIIDWEGAMLAPPEQDLFFFAGEESFWDLFWPNYTREVGPARLDAEMLGFYYYRRGLEDLADWLQRLLYTDQDDEAVRSALHDAGRILADLAHVETRLRRIAAHVALP
jgi:spectinomycin phosphotransferase